MLSDDRSRRPQCSGKQRISLVCLALGTVLLSGCVVPGSGLRPKQPALTSQVEHETLQVGALTRTYLAYTPSDLPDRAPLVIVLHGSKQTGGMMRVTTGYEFDRLADRHGFAVVYPNGYMKHWNDCRKKASYAAHSRDIGDKAFMRTLIDHFEESLGIDRKRVFAVGYSNGGQMAYRLALEMPETITAVAAIAANLPTDENCDCRKSDQPIAVMILNGTRDPINPYEGGNVRIFGFGNRGEVLSAKDSADYFARVNGHSQAPSLESSEAAEILLWRSDRHPEVALVSVEGGGHVVPQPVYKASFLFGRTSKAVNGPELIWEFFDRQW